MKSKGRSTRAERLASPFSWATNVKPNRSPNAAISGTGTISLPVPRSTTTCVLSIMQRRAEPWKYFTASVRKTLHAKRVKRGYAGK